MHNDKTTYRPNASKPVYKFNLKGELVHTYPRTTDAIHGEHIMYNKLKELIASGNSLRGHCFAFSIENGWPIREKCYTLIPDTDGLMPWETENGMFDISGWEKVCL